MIADRTGNYPNMSQYQTFPDAPGASPTLDKVKSLMLPDMGGRSFLDVGCNEGFFCGFARFLGASAAVGIDKSPLFIERASKRFPDCRFILQDWETLPDGPFDVILLASALHYADDQAALIERLVSALSDDGVLILELGIVSSSLNDWIEIDRGFDKRRYPTMKKLAEVLAPYAWKWVGPSVMQPGDPVGRHVVHVSRRKPVAYLLMLPPGYGKSSLASGLFPKAGVPVISGDDVVSAIADGRLPASDRLNGLIKERYSPFEIDRVIEAVFDEGLGGELTRLFAQGADGKDFALDAFVPVQRHQQVRKILLEQGYFPVALDWDRAGTAPGPPSVLLEQLDMFMEKVSADAAGVLDGPVRAWEPSGHIDELVIEEGSVIMRGWAIGVDGQLPSDWRVWIGWRKREITKIEKHLRPDVQAHHGLPHQRVGFVLVAKAPKRIISGLINDTVVVRCGLGRGATLTMRAVLRKAGRATSGEDGS